MIDNKELPSISLIVDWLRTEREITDEFTKIISRAPDDVDWGSETKFEIEWTSLVKETENKINKKFPYSNREQQVEAVRIFAQNLSKK